MRNNHRPSKLKLAKDTLRTLDLDRVRGALVPQRPIRACPDPTQMSFCELACITYEIRECDTMTSTCL